MPRDINSEKLLTKVFSVKERCAKMLHQIRREVSNLATCPKDVQDARAHFSFLTGGTRKDYRIVALAPDNIAFKICDGPTRVIELF